MLKEIYEQPKSINDTFRGRASQNPPEIYLGGLYNVFDKLDEAERIIIVACGTSWHAGLVGEYLIEEFARIPVEVEYASEFRYRNPIISKNDVIIAVSQSGETADTIAAVKMARELGATVIGICNVVGSSLTRETEAGVYTHAGPEIGVASTKAFSAQVTVLTMISLLLGKRRKKLSEKTYTTLIKELYKIPDKITQLLSQNETYKHVASLYKDATNCIYLGRGVLFPVALEGALKLKEISYIHVSNIQEVKARKGIIIAVVNEGDTTIAKLADHVLEVPETLPELAPLTTIIPLQLFSYYIAVMRGCNVDQPRNLAKSVTVE
jgi:glucosamine--fructose-6-phosphate aminotransferase (isomerizing)